MSLVCFAEVCTSVCFLVTLYVFLLVCLVSIAVVFKLTKLFRLEGYVIGQESGSMFFDGHFLVGSH